MINVIKRLNGPSEAGPILETINHLEREGEVAGLMDPVDVIVVDARHSLPLVKLIHHIFWNFSAPVHVFEHCLTSFQSEM